MAQFNDLNDPGRTSTWHMNTTLRLGRWAAETRSVYGIALICQDKNRIISGQHISTEMATHSPSKTKNKELVSYKQTKKPTTG